MRKSIAVVLIMGSLCSAANAVAQTESTKTELTQDKPDTTNTVQSPTDQDLNNVPVAEMPRVWFFMEDEFWYPFRFNMAESLMKARLHYRKGQLLAARAEIKEAITWLRLAKSRADEKSQRELQTVIADLDEIASHLDGHQKVSMSRLKQAFANANLALARHNFSRANKLVEKKDLLNASKRLVAAADHLKNAANSADVAPNPIIAQFYDDYSPFGVVDDTLALEPKQIKEDLELLRDALESLGGKLKEKAEGK